MAVWCRSASIALAVHLALFFLVTFTFKGTKDTYKIDLVFLGSILRSQEVTLREGHVVSGSSNAQNMNIHIIPRTQMLFWSKGISIDKPVFFKNFLFTVQEDAFRFSGTRVDLDDEAAEERQPERDIPEQAPLKMRLEHP